MTGTHRRHAGLRLVVSRDEDQAVSELIGQLGPANRRILARVLAKLETMQDEGDEEAAIVLIDNVMKALRAG